MKEFQVGDTVQLKSGGPKMTITYICLGNEVETMWFGEVFQKVEKGRFPIAVLVRA